MKTSVLLFTTALLFASHAHAIIPSKLPEFKNSQQLTEWRAQEAAENATKPTPTTSSQDIFYTGKPYLASTGTYAFKYRNYNPSLSRWTTEDPSGFPDGANPNAYVGNKPTSFFDFLGCTGKSVLWVITNNLFGNGYLDETGDYNYMEGFNSTYESVKSEMKRSDQDGEGFNYLSDGDIFDKRVVKSNTELSSVAAGYTLVLFFTHGWRDENDNFVFRTPDGTNQSGSPANQAIKILSCANGDNIGDAYFNNDLLPQASRYTYDKLAE